MQLKSYLSSYQLIYMSSYHSESFMMSYPNSMISNILRNQRLLRSASTKTSMRRSNSSLRFHDPNSISITRIRATWRKTTSLYRTFTLTMWTRGCNSQPWTSIEKPLWAVVLTTLSQIDKISWLCWDIARRLKNLWWISTSKGYFW